VKDKRRARRSGARGPVERQPGLDNWRGIGSFGTLGLEIVLCIALGFFGGRWLDGKLGTDPYLSVVGFFFGLAAAVQSIMRATKEMQAEAEREEREQGNPRPRYDKPSSESDVETNPAETNDTKTNEADAPADDEGAR